jgi:hypothetical protein
MRRLVFLIVATVLVAAGGAAAGGWAVRTRTLDLDAIHAWVRRPPLQVRHVDFVGLDALEPNALWQRLDVPAHTPLVDLVPAEIAGGLESHPRVADARVSRVPPGRLVIGITERSPVALDADTLEGIDASGARFPVAPREMGGLARLRGDADAALAVIAAAQDLGLELSSVDADDPRSIRVRLARGGPELTLAREPASELLRWLRLRSSGLLARYAPTQVDLRFGGDAVLRNFQIEEGSNGSQR